MWLRQLEDRCVGILLVYCCARVTADDEFFGSQLPWRVDAVDDDFLSIRLVTNSWDMVGDCAWKWHVRGRQLESQWCGPWDSEQNIIIHDSSDCLIVNCFNLCDSVKMP